MVLGGQSQRWSVAGSQVTSSVCGALRQSSSVHEDLGLLVRRDFGDNDDQLSDDEPRGETWGNLVLEFVLLRGSYYSSYYSGSTCWGSPVVVKPQIISGSRPATGHAEAAALKGRVRGPNKEYQVLGLLSIRILQFFRCPRQDRRKSTLTYLII